MTFNVSYQKVVVLLFAEIICDEGFGVKLHTYNFAALNVENDTVALVDGAKTNGTLLSWLSVGFNRFDFSIASSWANSISKNTTHLILQESGLA